MKLGRLARPVVRLRRAARQGGGQESGLAGLLDLSFASSAGDALVAVTLAGTQFLAIQPGAARSKVAMYLLTTMAPFAVLAPVIGPTLDRFANGRRIALGVTMLARAALVLTLARHLTSLYLYPIALALLVLSRAFGVARSAVVPRVMPADLTLVKVNSRLTLTGVAGGLLVAPLGYGIAAAVGYAWTLRLAALVFGGGMFLAWVLPPHVDSAAGERPAKGLGAATVSGVRGKMRRVLGELPAALRSAMAVRGCVGFLTLYLAFLLKENGFGLSGVAALGVAAGVGSGVGVFLGGRLRASRPELLIVIGLASAAVSCVSATVLYGIVTAMVASLVTTTAGSMSKLGLDAVIQRDVAEDTRSSAFARTETGLQLAWVIGGAIGLIPMPGVAGFAVAAAAMVVALGLELLALRRVSRRRRAHRGLDHRSDDYSTDDRAAEDRAADDCATDDRVDSRPDARPDGRPAEPYRAMDDEPGMVAAAGARPKPPPEDADDRRPFWLDGPSGH